MKCNLFLLTILCLFSLQVFSQGTIRGVLVDEESQEPLIGAVVKIESIGVGSVTDIDGAYSIQVPEGTYTVTHTYIGYQDKEITGVSVTADEINSLGVVSLGIGDDGNAIEAIVISVEMQKNTEAGLLNFQRNSTKIIDAVSAQTISKTGDSDVAAVIKRVPGVTIEGGKYVYVRGLGDRYSKSIINGLEIPGLDPERNTVQMDIFPSNIIDNIVVYKTFSPDLPGDFTGGMVDVVTKDYPQEKEFKVSTSLGYNTIATFNDEFLLTNNSFADIVVFGKINREIPISKDYDFGSISEVTASDLEMTKQFNNIANPTIQDNFLNTNFAVSYGNQYDLNNNKTFGIIGSASHKYSFNYNPEFIRQDLLLLNNSDGSIDPDNSIIANGSTGSAEGILNGLLGVSYKGDKSNYGVKIMHTRSGENTSLLTDIERNEQTSIRPFQVTNLNYFQRQITNVVVDGENYFDERKLNYGISGTITNVDNPDLARTDIFNLGGLSFGTNSSYTREWRELEDQNFNAKIDFQNPVNVGNSTRKSFLKAGVYSNFKQRDFEINVASITGVGSVEIPNGKIDEILTEPNLAGPNQQEGYALRFDRSEFNSFLADSKLLAGYAMGDIHFTDKIQFIGGARIENFIMTYDGRLRDRGFINEETLNATEVLPSANLVYELQDNMNLRGSYNRTLARPSFREKSGASILDPIQGRFFNGNIDLVQTKIDNFDLRWEYFFDRTEMVSLSPFFKKFDQPIEILALDQTNLRPINQDEADVYGFEFELRKDFGFVNKTWENLSFNGNFTFVKSEIDFTDQELDKYENTMVEAPENRTLLGQSPYTINTGLSYQQDNSGWDASVNYNVKGKTLAFVGIGLVPNIYEDPFHNLDLKFSKSLGQKNRSKVSISGNNLLNDNIDFFYEFDNQEKGIYNSYDIGQTFSVGYSLSLD